MENPNKKNNVGDDDIYLEMTQVVERKVEIVRGLQCVKIAIEKERDTYTIESLKQNLNVFLPDNSWSIQTSDDIPPIYSLEIESKNQEIVGDLNDLLDSLTK